MGRAALAIKYQELREVAESCADKLQRLGKGVQRVRVACKEAWRTGCMGAPRLSERSWAGEASGGLGHWRKR